MPHIFDNIELQFMPALKEMLGTSTRADFCVGYFNLRGWGPLGEVIEEQYPGGDGHCCRLLIGMHFSPDDEIKRAYSLLQNGGIDAARAILLKQEVAARFKTQLTIGTPTDADEASLRRLARQLRAGKVIVKLFLRNSLHAKLYLVHRIDPAAPIVGYVGSSNLTFAGMMKQFELNVDVVEGDAAHKLARWFDDRWSDRWCLDISAELAEIIERSWAREVPIPPYHIYIKMAYHLARDAREGLSEFQIPRDFADRLFEYQKAAVLIAAHHLNSERRRGVLLGDVVGLGKTLMATALARIFEDDFELETLILCPKNLVPMWQQYVDSYRMRARIYPISQVRPGFADEVGARRLVIIDESHNLRNPEGTRYRAVHEYIQRANSRCILLSATPYNKGFTDLGAQLRLFVDEAVDLGVRPERLLREIGGEAEFTAKHQCAVRSVAAFEKSAHADDWRDLMRLFMVRRTRGFIKQHYAETDPASGRKYLTLSTGARVYFPDRIPRTVRFPMDKLDADDPYARLYDQDVVDAIRSLALPRYGLGNYIEKDAKQIAGQAEERILDDLGRAGRRLRGFCRINLFKRLESTGLAFIQSLERHVLRNYIFLHSIKHCLPLPIGASDSALLDSDTFDGDADDPSMTGSLLDDPIADTIDAAQVREPLCNSASFENLAAEIYDRYATSLKSRFRWIRPDLFESQLEKDLQSDAETLQDILKHRGHWEAGKDRKLDALHRLLAATHATEKVLVFTQYADTVGYLTRELGRRGLKSMAGATGQSANPTRLAQRFSPDSNTMPSSARPCSPAEELRVLIATDVLSEGQNLQDAHVVVNFDLPWAIIRLIQRVGRVDRIGQKSESIFAYCFYPMDGVEEVIKLRRRVRQRLTENAEVVGTDEEFFDDLQTDERFRDIYNERSGILDDEDQEVDLSSQAFQIWQDAITADPSLKKTVEEMPDVVYSAKAHAATADRPLGGLVYLRTSDETDALAWTDESGAIVSESPLAILRAAACPPDTPARPRSPRHHEAVRKAVKQILEEQPKIGGQLGKAGSARYRTYDRLKTYALRSKGTLLESDELNRTIEDIYRHPLRAAATATLNRQLRAGISDETLAELCMALRSDGRLCVADEEAEQTEPRILCSLGLVGGAPE